MDKINKIFIKISFNEQVFINNKKYIKMENKNKLKKHSYKINDFINKKGVYYERFIYLRIQHI